ncbi:MAG: YgjV family protein [Lishizhenia sp.]
MEVLSLKLHLLEVYMEINATEIIGYLGSLLILVAFTMSDIKRLRYLNSIGCALFVVYGIFLGSIPIVLTNVAILFVNFYYLFLKKKSHENLP